MGIPILDTFEPSDPSFSIVRNQHVEGGVKTLTWTKGAGVDEYDNVQDALAALVPSGGRPVGTIVRMKEITESLPTEWYWNGSWQAHKSWHAEYGLGIYNGLEVTDAGGGDVNVSPGKLVNWKGEVFQRDEIQTVSFPGDGTYIVVQGYNLGVSYVPLSTGLNNFYSYMPVAVVIISGGVVDRIEECRYIANGSKSKNEILVGGSTGTDGANFDNLREALIWLNCFSPTNTMKPKTVKVVGSQSLVNPGVGGVACIDFANDAALASSFTRIKGLRIEGVSAQINSSRPMITFGFGAESCLFDLNWMDNISIDNLEFDYNGTTNSSNDDICVFRNAGANFHCKNVIAGSASLTHFAYWTSSTLDINIGGFVHGDLSHGTVFENVTLASPVNDSNSLFSLQSASHDIKGNLVLKNCLFNGITSEIYDKVVEASDVQSCADFRLTLDNVHIKSCEGICFDVESDGTIQATNCHFGSALSAYQDVENCSHASFSNCTYSNDITLDGDLYSNCKLISGNITAGNEYASMVNCDFGALVHERMLKPSSMNRLQTLGNGTFANSALIGLAIKWRNDSEVRIEGGLGFADGYAVSKTSFSDVDVTNSANWLNSFDPATLTAGQYRWGFVFLRRDSQPCIDIFPPNTSTGGLNGSSTPHSTWNSIDYVYVGSFLLIHDSGLKVRKFTRTGDLVYFEEQNQVFYNTTTSDFTTTVDLTLPHKNFPGYVGSGTHYSGTGLICSAKHFILDASELVSSDIKIYSDTAQKIMVYQSEISSDSSRSTNSGVCIIPLHYNAGAVEFIVDINIGATTPTAHNFTLTALGYVEPLNRIGKMLEE